MENFFTKENTAFMAKILTCFILLLALTACGGGGGGSPSKPSSSRPNESPIPSSTAASSTISSIDASSKVNSSVDNESEVSSVTTNSSSSSLLTLSSSSAEQNSTPTNSSTQSSLLVTTSFSSIPSSFSSSSEISSSAISNSASSTNLNGELTISGLEQKFYFHNRVNLTANVSDGSDWQYQWRIVEDDKYQRRDAYGFTWDSSTISSDCQPQHFGSLISGKLYPPRTGLYRFVAAADTAFALSIRKDGSYISLASSTESTPKVGYFNHNSQQSEWIELTAGKAYPIKFFISNRGLRAITAYYGNNRGALIGKKFPIPFIQNPMNK